MRRAESDIVAFKSLTITEADLECGICSYRDAELALGVTRDFIPLVASRSPRLT